MRDLAMESFVDLPETEYFDVQRNPKVSPRLTHGLVQGARPIMKLHGAATTRGFGSELGTYGYDAYTGV